MLKEVRRRVLALVDSRLFRVRPAEALPLRLVQRRIFVLPTRFGLAFAATLLVMLTTSINYNLSLGYGLTFGLGGIGVVSILHAFRNLLHLEIHVAACPDTYAGSPASFALRIHNEAARSRVALHLGGGNPASGKRFDLEPREDKLVAISMPTAKRGWMRPGRLTLSTVYPLGLIRAWTVFAPDVRCLILPCPETPASPLPDPSAWAPGDASGSAGDDDFAGLRAHQPADQPGHIAWRVAAKTDQLLTKQFKGGGAAELQLTWFALPVALGTEERLARLARWVLLAEAEGLRCSLTIPGHIVRTGSGTAHRDKCLRALALFGLSDD